MKTFARIIKPNFVSKLLTKRVFLLVAVLAVAGVVVTAKASATEYTFNVTVPQTPVLEVSLTEAGTQNVVTGGSIEVVPTMATASFNEVGVDVTVGTSNANGFDLIMNVSGGLTDSSTGATIPSLAEDTTDHEDGYTCTVSTGANCDFTVNSWGFRIASNTSEYTNPTNYLPIPVGPTTIHHYDGVTDGERTTFYFGSRINALQRAGTYTTTVNFIAVADIEDILYMQQNDLGTVLASMDSTKDIGDTFYLNDSRDGKAYLIGKLKDGKYWMLENLALDPATTTYTLSSTNTNMPASDSPDYSVSFVEAWNDKSIVRTSGFTSYTVPMVNNKSKTKKVALAMQGDGTSAAAKNEPIGVYYNYCAATVGTYCYDSSSGVDVPNTIRDAAYDICPKGWRMPTGGASGEYQALRNTYSSNADYVNALHAGLSGYFYDGSASSQGSYGYFWSSTYYSATNMYLLYVYTTNVYPQSSSYRIYGFSVRCVFVGS